MQHLLLISTSQVQIQTYLTNLIVKNQINKNNILRIYPLKEEIVIDQIRDLKKELLVQVVGGRLIIFYQFDKANLQAQNALLKIVEESATDRFILLSSNEYKVTATLRSRFKIIRFLPNITLSLTAKDEQLFSLLSKKPLEHFSLISHLDRAETLEFLDKFLLYYRFHLLQDKAAALIIKKIFYWRQLVEENNLNCQLVLDNLLIFIHKTSMM